MEKRNQFSKVLGNELKTLRDESNLTLAEVAKIINVSHSLVSYYEKGMRIPSVDVLKGYGNKFDIDFNLLFELRVQCIKESYDVLTDDANVNLKNEYELIMYYEEKLNKKE
ncbi:helix-turn-helix domain-containing protein [Lysinibacillus sp. NPDC086135]|uniref:helix-turn-helix domain-containing protein n=1 Tax=Lysinibacillus sp. NPDC086135 TaxID=3364130 RepID=UPI003827D3B5